MVRKNLLNFRRTNCGPARPMSELIPSSRLQNYRQPFFPEGGSGLQRGWLGRQDSNLGMAESKSMWFALFINGHSEKSSESDPNLINRLASISEWRDLAAPLEGNQTDFCLMPVTRVRFTPKSGLTAVVGACRLRAMCGRL